MLRDEQATLYEFTDNLFRALSPEDVYEAALVAIRRALGCDRASILLFDDAGAVRFVAWTGLSEEYRRAVDGHSPWSSDVKDPQPICSADLEASDLPEPLKERGQARRHQRGGFHSPCRGRPIALASSWPTTRRRLTLARPKSIWRSQSRVNSGLVFNETVLKSPASRRNKPAACSSQSSRTPTTLSSARTSTASSPAGTKVPSFCLATLTMSYLVLAAPVVALTAVLIPPIAEATWRAGGYAKALLWWAVLVPAGAVVFFSAAERVHDAKAGAEAERGCTSCCRIAGRGDARQGRG